ncbi:MAG TPA: ribosome-associated translation inhibitor RaiA [Streptosporangiaceae bacterium]
MDIIFRGRRTSIQERFRDYATAKLGKIVKLDQKTISIDVEVTLERNPRQSAQRERVELTLYSRGPVVRAEAAADDRYQALDQALAKLETHMRRAGERRKARNSAHVPPLEAPVAQPAGVPGHIAAVSAPDRPGPARESGAGAAVPAAADWAAGPGTGDPDWPDAELELDGVVPIAMEGDGPLVVREKFHSATPMTIDHALLEMELVGHDFFLFRDETCHLPSVVYRRRGYHYGVIRLVEDVAARTPSPHVPVD